MSYTIKVISEHGSKVRLVNAEQNERLMDVFEKNDIPLYAPCGGKCLCGKCLVKVKSDINVITPAEKNLLSDKQVLQGFRLACAFIVEADAEVVLEDNFDGIIMTNVLKRDYSIDPVISVEQYDNGSNAYGVAFDIGTTTVVGYLLDMKNGDIIGSVSEMNAQRIYGSDVISRITYTMENDDGSKRLKKAVCDQIGKIIRRLSSIYKVKPENIKGISVAGNTTMLHFLMGLDARGIAVAPFTPANLKEVETTVGNLSIPLTEMEDCPVYILPCISSYVGADITAAILASGMTKSPMLSLLLDVGTNGEIALGNNERVITCSTAAGPAFEGATIKHGMGGVSGAIDSVAIKNGQVNITTINDEDPKGICGSGVIDATAQLVNEGIIDETGRMLYPDEVPDEYKEMVMQNGNSREFVLCRRIDGENLVFTQEDVREVQLAKAAISAGVNVLLMKMGKKASDVDRVFLAGGFGSYINQESAVMIGLLGKEFKDKIITIGNAAGAGAIQYLLSRDGYRKCIDISKQTEYIELSDSKEFQEEYVNCMFFD